MSHPGIRLDGGVQDFADGRRGTLEACSWQLVNGDSRV